MIDARLVAAYRAADYCVDVPGVGCLRLHIGLCSAEFEAALQAAGVWQWAIVTAMNPGSVALTAAENEDRQRQLQAVASAAGWTVWPGVNQAPSGEWPAESSICILNIPIQDAKKLAVTFGQAAIVVPDDEGVPQLLCLPSS